MVLFRRPYKVTGVVSMLTCITNSMFYIYLIFQQRSLFCHISRQIHRLSNCSVCLLSLSVSHGRKFFDHNISVLTSVLLHEEVYNRIMDKAGKNILDRLNVLNISKLRFKQILC